jgi:hypothetical protein
MGGSRVLASDSVSCLLYNLSITFSPNLLICLSQTEYVTYLPSSSAFTFNLILITPLTYLRLHVRLLVMPPSDPTSTLCLRSGPRTFPSVAYRQFYTPIRPVSGLERISSVLNLRLV